MARLHRVLATLTLLVAAAALTASPALARKRDHDKLPDRWERKHHLNLERDDAGRDSDHDGLSNYREYRAHTNPRKRDSDRDGLPQGTAPSSASASTPAIATRTTTGSRTARRTPGGSPGSRPPRSRSSSPPAGS